MILAPAAPCNNGNDNSMISNKKIFAEDTFANNNEQSVVIQKPKLNNIMEPLYATVVRKSLRNLNSAAEKRQQNSLEAFYGGKELANTAAYIIQRAYRAHRLQKQFSRLISIALSNRQLEPVEVDVDTGLEVNTEDFVHHRRQSSVVKPEDVPDNIDLLLYQAAGLDPFSSLPATTASTSGPSARRINRGPPNRLRRSASLRVNGSMKREAKRAEINANRKNVTRDDSILVHDQAGDHEIYVTKDSLYHYAASIASMDNDLNDSNGIPPECPPLRGHYGIAGSKNSEVKPLPPQRTVSFLCQHKLPQKVCNPNQDRPLPPPPPMRLNSSSEGIYDSNKKTASSALHLRSYSSPAPLSPKPEHMVIDIPDDNVVQDQPLPPPPYISPPLPAQSAPAFPAPPTPPPPPPPGPSSNCQQQQVHRGVCDSSSSASSIDSGFCRSSVGLESPTQWIHSPQAIACSPEGSALYNALFEPRPSNYGMIDNLVNSSNDNNEFQRLPPHRNISAASMVLKQKKTVRIQTPMTSQSSGQGADDVVRRRQYRVGLNLFNQNPDRGMEYLLKKSFLDFSPAAVGKFLRGRKGLSKKMIGEYLCQLQRPFNLAALHCFIHEMDFSGLHLDIALRQLYQEITFPGEAQKVEKIVEVFAKRYIACNQMFIAGFRSADSLFVLAYAIVLLNTDLHSKAVRPNKRMKREDFVRNLRGVDAGSDLDPDMLRGIYDRIKIGELKAGPDHASQVARVEEAIIKSSAMPVADQSRRLVCFCRLTEVPDVHKKAKKADAHQRGLFLFNDILVVTKTVIKKGSTLHQYRFHLVLRDLRINVFSTAQYPYGIQLQDRLTGKVAATFNSKSETDQQRFVNDLQESVAEVSEMDRAKNMLNDAVVIEPDEDLLEHETLC